MKMLIESTGDLVSIDGVQTRRWVGVTENGERCEVFIHRVEINPFDYPAELERDLLEQKQPSWIDWDAV